eukprot:460009_1
MYDNKHEETLIQLIAHEAVCFHSNTLKNDKLWKKGDSKKKLGIISHYKVDEHSFCYLRAAMDFTKILKQNAILDFYSYLQCGSGSKCFLWDSTFKTKTIQILDDLHKLMYGKNDAEAHPILKQFSGSNERDIYYISSRFKKINITMDKQYYFDMVGSLNYSISGDERFVNKCVPAFVQYAGFVLVENKNYNDNKHKGSWKTKLVYISCFNPNVKLPTFIKKKHLKGKGVEIMKAFYDSWISTHKQTSGATNKGVYGKAVK